MQEPRKGKSRRTADPSGRQPRVEPAGRYMELMEGYRIALENKKYHGMSPEINNRGHDDEADGIWNVSLFQNAHRNDGSIGEFVVEGSVATPFQKMKVNYSKNT